MDEAEGRGPMDSAVSRRLLLRASGVAALASLSGCSNVLESGSDGDRPTDDGAGNGDGGPTIDSSEPITIAGGDDGETATVDEDRIEEALSELSLAEKIGQMSQLEPGGGGGGGGGGGAGGSRQVSGQTTSTIAERNVGSVLFGGASPPGTTAREAARYFNEVQSAAMDSVGVPLLIGVDAVHGNATVEEAAVFPHQIGMGATWDTDLAGRAAAVTGRSLAAMGVNWTFSPVADLAYDPRWGRYYESFSEDPHVTGAFVAAMVRGYEQVERGDERVAASVKHFAGYSMPETGIDREPADVSRRTLEDAVLPSFRAGVDAGSETVMANSGSVNGIPAHASEWLLTDVLRERWGFDGLVVSDWNDVHRLAGAHGYASDFAEAVEMAVDAGVDVYMGPHAGDLDEYQSALETLVEDGRVPESRIDEATRRVLRVKDRLGLFDDPTVPVERYTETVGDRDRELARRAARESLTLLQNDASALPFRGDSGTVLVTGPTVDSPTRQLGGWTMGWQGLPSEQRAPETVTIREGVEAAAPAGVDVTVVETGPDRLSDGARSDVEAAASEADLAVAAIGEGAYAEGSGDIDDLRLPDGQRELVSTLEESDVTTAGVLVAGRPRGSPWLFDRLDAALMAYYPGSEGGRAIGEAVFGAVDPAGRLPFTWPRDTGQIPEVLTHRSPPHGERTGSDRPLFEFGRGEGYARVTTDGLLLSTTEVSSVDDQRYVRAELDVRNHADGATDRVVVLTADYVHYEEGSESPAIPPDRRVVGFDRVRIPGGETTSAEIDVDLAALAVTGGDVVADGERVVPAGRYDLAADGASRSLVVAETAPLN